MKKKNLLFLRGQRSEKPCLNYFCDCGKIVSERSCDAAGKRKKNEEREGDDFIFLLLRSLCCSPHCHSSLNAFDCWMLGAAAGRNGCSSSCPYFPSLSSSSSPGPTLYRQFSEHLVSSSGLIRNGRPDHYCPIEGTIKDLPAKLMFQIAISWSTINHTVCHRLNAGIITLLECRAFKMTLNVNLCTSQYTQWREWMWGQFVLCVTDGKAVTAA